MLEVKNLSVKYGSLTIVRDLSFSLEEKQWLMIVGPNGAGKSTLVNAVAQGIPYEGSVLYEGKDVARLKPSQRAKNIGVLAQNHHIEYSFTVEELVRLGRYAHSPGIFSSRNDEDEQKINFALELTGLLPIRNQSMLTLSGGELQRAFLAQLFAQDPKILILDEPTNSLDLLYQKQVFELIGGWVRTPGHAVISVVHDLSLAKLYGTHALLLSKATPAIRGTIEQVLTGEILREAYGMDVNGWMRNMLGRWQ
ncbi:MAG: ABC transporter ATP-binding protein [Bacillota bacterium]